MIKKSVFEDELISGMQDRLVKQAKQEESDHLEKAADYLNSAAEIFEDMGMSKRADQILMILAKIAQKHINDSHTKGLTPEKMVKNLEQHGHPMNLADDGEQEIDDTLEVSDGSIELHDFEEERDDLHSHAMGNEPYAVFPEKWDDHKKHEFIKKVKHELWLNTDDFDWTAVSWRDLEYWIDFDKSVDDNVNAIGMKGIVPKKYFKLSTPTKEKLNPNGRY